MNYMGIKVKNIDIVIESDEEFFQRAEKVFSDLDKKKLPNKLKTRLSFQTLDSFRKILTKQRLKLLHVIKHQHPKSIYELAKMTKRDMKNIRDDLSKLQELGLIELVKEKENKRKPLIPITKYDKLQVSIEI